MMAELSAAGLSVGVGIAPIILSYNDSHVPEILRRSKKAGATRAFMSMLRLPGSVKDYFVERLLPHLEEVTLAQGETVYQHEQSVRFAYFPTDSVIVMLSATAEGGMTEVAMAGCRGIAGVRVLLNTQTTPFRATVLIPGGATIA